MKKLLSIILAAALAAPLASARSISDRAISGDDTDRWEITAGVSAINYFNMILYIFPAALTNSPDDGLENTPEFAWPGSFTIQPRFNVNRWFSVGMEFAGQYWNSHGYKTEDITDPDTGDVTGQKKTYKGTASMLVLAAMPTAHFKYMVHPRCTLYGEAQLGVAYYSFNRSDDPNNVIFSFQAIPFGVTFGRDLYGFAEVGIGTQWMGGHIGVGYRF
jgi:hypothetical protein